MLKFETPKSRQEILADDPLAEFFIWWMDDTKKDIDALKRRLGQACRELELQTLLEAHPTLLVQHLGGGHGRWVIPKQKLGAEYVTDFIVGEKHSAGFEWQAVELESPNARMFTKKGNPTKELTHAIRQVQDWRAWLQRNQNYAARPKTEGGLGLRDITSSIPGVVLIGRRRDNDKTTNELRRQMMTDLNIQIRSFDSLIDYK